MLYYIMAGKHPLRQRFGGPAEGPSPAEMIDVCVYIYVCMYVCMYIYIYIRISLSLCVYVYI